MDATDVAYLLLASSIWGASFMFQRIAVPHFGPLPLAFVRVAIAAVLLVALPEVQRSSIVASWRELLLLGVVNTAIPFALFAYGTLSVSAGLAAVLNGTAPLFTAVIALAIFGERMAARQIVGLLGGFAGVVVLVWRDIGAPQHAWGVIACLAAAACYGVGTHMIRRRFAAVSSSTVAAGSQVFAALTLAAPAALTWPTAIPPRSAWASAITVGAVCTALAYFAFFRLVRSVGATKAIVVAYLIPMFGIIWGALFLDETVTGSMITGCVMIVAGVAIASQARTEGPATAAAEAGATSTR